MATQYELGEGGLLLVFDVESMGLHGEGFAVGAVVVDRTGQRVRELYAACPPDGLPVRPEDWQWLKENCLPGLYPPNHLRPSEVRDAFWAFLQEFKGLGASVWAECGWPVEASFLIACVRDDPSRWWDGPFPLEEVVSARKGAGLERKGKDSRLPDELPAHNPLHDARQSARLLLEAIGATS